MNKKTAEILPTNEAIFLYFLSCGVSMPLIQYGKIWDKLSNESKQIASKIMDNPNYKYKKPIPRCKHMPRYTEAVKKIDAILNVLGAYGGGSEAVLGYLKYYGVITENGGFRKILPQYDVEQI